DRADRNWRVFGDLRDVNLQVLTAALPAVETPLPQRGNGDLSVWLEWGSDSLDRGMIEAALDDVAWLPGHGVEADGYEHIELSAEWVRAADGWRLALNDIDLTRDGRTWPGGSGSVLEWHADAQGETSRVNVQSEFL